MLILLPPSEAKTAPRRGKPLDLGTLAFPELTAMRETMLHALLSLCAGDPGIVARVLDVPPTRLDLVALNRAVRESPTARADAVYAGVLYDALGFASLTAAARRRATARVLITSSLFGLVTPTDRIPAYRLSGDASLPGLGGVAAAWRTTLGSSLVERVGSGLLIDLRSGMYAAFWRPVGVRVATIRVLHEVAGTRTVVSHFNKATKGRIVRELLQSGADPRTPDRLAETMRDLGWTVECTEVRGTPRLDVVVSDLTPH